VLDVDPQLERARRGDELVALEALHSGVAQALERGDGQPLVPLGDRDQLPVQVAQLVLRLELFELAAQLRPVEHVPRQERAQAEEERPHRILAQVRDAAQPALVDVDDDLVALHPRLDAGELVAAVAQEMLQPVCDLICERGARPALRG
jgi:hypothetical protein